METNARTQSHAGISTENTADGDTADDSRDIGDRNRKVNNRRSGARNAKAKGGKSKTHSGGNGDGDGTSIVSRTFSKTIRDTEWAYLHLELITSSALSDQQAPLDIITVRTYLTSALVRFLGDTGAGIPIDILKLEAAAPDGARPRSTAQADGPDNRPTGPRKHDRNDDHDGGGDVDLLRKKSLSRHSLGTCWIRIPAQDQLPVTSSLTTWSSASLPADAARSSTLPWSSSPAHASLTWRIKAQGKFLGLLVAKGGEQKVWEY